VIFLSRSVDIHIRISTEQEETLHKTNASPTKIFEIGLKEWIKKYPDMVKEKIDFHKNEVTQWELVYTACTQKEESKKGEIKNKLNEVYAAMKGYKKLEWCLGVEIHGIIVTQEMIDEVEKQQESVS